MSVLRLSRPGYETVLIPLDDGAVGRTTHSRLGIRGIVGGAYVVPVPAKTGAQSQAEYKAREDPVARAAAAHDYYLRNKATIMEKQRERRKLTP